MKKHLFNVLVLSSAIVLSGCFTDDFKECEKQFNHHQFSQAKPYCEKAANAGSAASQFLYSQILFSDYKSDDAIKWLEKSADQRYYPALFQLGERYDVGDLFKKDQMRAQFYYDLSCKAGSVKGCERVAMFQKSAASGEKIDDVTRSNVSIAHQDIVKQNVEFEEQIQKLREELAKEREVLAEQKARAVEEKRDLELQLLKFKQKVEQLENEKRLFETQQEGGTTLSQESTGNSVSSLNSNVVRKNTTNLKFYDGLAVFKENRLYGFVNSNGEVVIPATFAYAGRFSKQRSAVRSATSKLWGFIDTNGNYVVEPEYCMLGAFSDDGLAGVYKGGQIVSGACQGGKWGFMDTAGNWVIEPIFDQVDRFVKGKARVTFEGKSGYINQSGEWIP